MVTLIESVRSLCPDLDPVLVTRHFHCLPAAYIERYSIAEIVRHLRLLAGLNGGAVGVEVRPLASQTFEVTVAGIDHSGILACVSTAFAALGFGLEDVQLSPYLDMGSNTDGTGQPRYFIIVLRVSGSLRGQTLPEFTEALRERCARLSCIWFRAICGRRKPWRAIPPSPKGHTRFRQLRVALWFPTREVSRA